MAAAAQNAIHHLIPPALRRDKGDGDDRGKEKSQNESRHSPPPPQQQQHQYWQQPPPHPQQNQPQPNYAQYPTSDEQRYSQQQEPHYHGDPRRQQQPPFHQSPSHPPQQYAPYQSPYPQAQQHHPPPSLQHPHNPQHGPQNNKPRKSDLEQERDEEKRRIAGLQDVFYSNGPMEPDQIAKDPRQKVVGHSSRSLRQEDFELMKTLGTGTFARVWLTRLARPYQRDQDRVFALKILRKVDVIRLKQVEHVRNERNVLAAVAGHPFITTMIASFQDRESLYMLLDYCPGGEVFSYLRRARRFNEPTSQFYAAEIVLILEFLHENEGVAYRDLKPENILIDAEGHLKLVDFGFAKRIYNRETYTLCGTPEYLAPEVIRNTGHGCAVDWWAFGILVYEFLVGQPPFWDQNVLKIYEQIVEGKVRYPSAMSPNARDLISKLCTVDTSKRLGNMAGGAGAVKAHPWFKEINWDDLYHRRMHGPIVPHLRGPADTRNFDEYDPEPEGRDPYTEELQEKWDGAFKDF